MTRETPDLETLADRLAEVERKYARLRLACVLAACLIGVAAAIGRAWPASRSISAEQFVLCDSRGRTRAEFGVGEDEEPRLVFLDAHGRSRAGLGMTQEALVGLSLTGKAGENRLVLAVRPDGSPQLILQDADGKPRLALDDQPSLTMYNGEGGEYAELKVWTGGVPKMRLFDAGGNLLFATP